MKALFVFNCLSSEEDAVECLFTLTPVSRVSVLAAVALSLMAMYAIAVIVERWLEYGMARRQSRKAEQEINFALRFNDLQAAIAVSDRYPRSHSAFLFRSVLIKLHPLPQINHIAAERARLAFESAIAQRRLKFREGLDALLCVAWGAPLIALFAALDEFGDVFNELGCFGPYFSIANFTTALDWMKFGLIIAAPTALAYRCFSVRVERFVFDMNEYSN
ncbi:MAG: hypothetical protein AB1631_22345, partial [Acidobacteriota bacterium]